MATRTRRLLSVLIMGLPLIYTATAVDERHAPKRRLLSGDHHHRPHRLSEPNHAPAAHTAQPGRPPHALDVPIYRPPLRGAPGGRVAGGTRAPGRSAMLLSVLAPDHTGLSAQAQPVLTWYISHRLPYPVEVTIIDEQSISPLVEIHLPPPQHPGLQHIRLADYNFRLVPETLYQWFVTLVVDPDRRSKDLITGATILHTVSSEALRVRLAQAGRTREPFVYAAAGLWYDTLTAISTLIEATPQDKGLRQQRAALLEQVGLHEVVKSEQKRGGGA